MYGTFSVALVLGGGSEGIASGSILTDRFIVNHTYFLKVFFSTSSWLGTALLPDATYLFNSNRIILLNCESCEMHLLCNE
jgi:hypothetical protein